MSFFGYLSAPISIPPVYDTTPCLEHLMEYEDCVIDTGSERLEFFMPAWPTLWPGLTEGAMGMKNPEIQNGFIMPESDGIPNHDNYQPLSKRQKQLLYE